MQKNPVHFSSYELPCISATQCLVNYCLIFNHLPGELTMTKTEFATLCLELTLDPYIALENENLVEALQNRDDRKAIEILTNEF